jgi:hypothetical protein
MLKRPSRSLLPAILVLAIAGTGPAFVRAADPSDLQESSEALREAIERDQQRLKELVSTAVSAEEPPLRESPELREIGQRLPALQRKLRKLEKGRPARPAPPAVQ